MAGGRALIVDVTLAGNGQDSASDTALNVLRNQALPATLGKASGISYAVTGSTASNYDDTRLLDARNRDSKIVVVGQRFFDKSSQCFIVEDLPPRQIGEACLLCHIGAASKGRWGGHVWPFVVRPNRATQHKEYGKENEHRPAYAPRPTP